MASSKLLSCLVLCITVAGVVQCSHHGTLWASAEMEAQDERHDAEIFRAVVTSMAEWHLRKLSSHRKRRADASVCYPEVGCFQDSGPFGYLDMLPSPPEEVDTHFLLYSRRNRGDVPLLDVPFSNLSTAWADAAKRFNASSPTKVIVHGFGSSCSNVWVYEMRSTLMAVEDCNVICVDWERGATIPNYVRAAANTRMVGKQVALLLAGLQKHAGLPVHRVHVIGFSLGAHVAGFAGAELKNLSRITGLDPAGPLFESQDPRARLDATDANFVDVIHSNGENLILGGLGTRQPLGHVDFYPNGGRMQKGCANLFVGAVSDILWYHVKTYLTDYFDIGIHFDTLIVAGQAIYNWSDIQQRRPENEARSLCNHRRAYKFFTDSVSPRCHFPAAACDSYESFLQGRCFPCDPPSRPCGNMGYYADRAMARGPLYLVTRDEEPFCAHQYHVRVESSPSVLPVVSYGRIQITLIGDSDFNETFTLTQKDDEQLQVGGSLSRIVVPHPVMQEPRGVQLLYTAYSGWISSGLARWSIDKVTLSDSFGKSSSVCKKDLVLESGLPVLLPLFAGECNPPRDPTNAQLQAAGPSSDNNEILGGLSGLGLYPAFNLSTLLSQHNTSHPTRFVPTQVVHVGDEGLNDTAPTSSSSPPTSSPAPEDVASTDAVDEVALLDLLDATGPAWQPLLDDLPETANNGLDGNTRNRDDARAFDDHLQVSVTTQLPSTANGTDREDATVPIEPETSPPPAEVAASAAKPEISEPVLVRTSTEPAIGGRRSFHQADAGPAKPEITEPVLKPTTSTTTTPPTTSSSISAATNRTTALDEESTEAPVTEAGAGRDLRDKTTTPEWTPAVELNPPPLGGTHIWQHWPPSRSAPAAPSTASGDKESHRAANNSRAFSFFDADPSQPSPPPPTGNWSERSITVQLLPQRLVALLEQAERYARLAFLPFAAVNSFFTGRDLESAVTTPAAPAGKQGSAGSAGPQRRAKHVTASAAPSAGTTLAPTSGEPTPYLVPLTYSRDSPHPKVQASRYIPLSKPKRAST